MSIVELHVGEGGAVHSKHRLCAALAEAVRTFLSRMDVRALDFAQFFPGEGFEAVGATCFPKDIWNDSAEAMAAL